VICPTDLGALSIENSRPIKENVKLIKTTRDSISFDTEARDGSRMNNVCGGH
jgi:hypothetical protein